MFSNLSDEDVYLSDKAVAEAVLSLARRYPDELKFRLSRASQPEYTIRDIAVRNGSVITRDGLGYELAPRVYNALQTALGDLVEVRRRAASQARRSAAFNRIMELTK